MTRDALVRAATHYIAGSPDNFIGSDYSLSDRVTGLPMYDAPLIRCGSADDPLFEGLRAEGAIGPHFLPPGEWLPGARTVISIFLPLTADIRKDNGRDMSWPSPGWLHARIEGQAMIAKFTAHLRDLLIKEGHAAVAPCLDDRMKVGVFTSNWSERHAAYICGLGTFGLSKGLITERGVAGRFTSIITDLELPVDGRPYQGLYDYCSMCGACARNCPAGAISLAGDKDHQICSDFLDEVRGRHRPRYGCGKCQVRVPCEGKALL